MSGQSQAVDDEKDEQISKALDCILEHLISACLLKDPREVLHKPPCFLFSWKGTGAADLHCLFCHECTACFLCTGVFSHAVSVLCRCCCGSDCNYCCLKRVLGLQSQALGEAAVSSWGGSGFESAPQLGLTPKACLEGDSEGGFSDSEARPSSFQTSSSSQS